MKKLKQEWSILKKYPVIFLFFGFIFLYSCINFISPDAKTSEIENRSLAQKPSFSLAEFVNNKWTANYNKYIQDQLLFRNDLVTIYSVLETAQGKLENNGVWYAKDDYQIVENSFLSKSQEQRLPINTTAVVELSERHPGQVSVLIVPSPANILSDKLRFNPPQIDENALIDNIFSQVSAAGATVIDVRPNFVENKDDYLYYRTDHHWTTTGGAWLAYQTFCDIRGLSPSMPNAEKIEVQDFYGTNYAKTKYFATVPDTLTYYDIKNNLTVYQQLADGTYEAEDGSIMQAERFNEYDKYSAFLRGNNGYSVLNGNGKGSILVIKDSYGNSFIPYLIENYATIGIIDLRAWLSVDSTFEEGNYDEILVLYSFEPFSQDMYANRMGTAMQK